MKDVEKFEKIFGKTKEEALKSIDEATKLGHGIYGKNKNVEKFKELLENTLDLNVDLTRQCNKRKRDVSLIKRLISELNYNKQELIKMYEEN